MSRRTTRRLTHIEFQNATEGMVFSSSLKVAVYMYLVDGYKLSEISESSGHKIQAIQRKSKQVWSSHLQVNEFLPEGWVREEVSLPKAEMKSIQQRSASLLLSLKEELQNEKLH